MNETTRDGLRRLLGERYPQYFGMWQRIMREKAYLANCKRHAVKFASTLRCEHGCADMTDEYIAAVVVAVTLGLDTFKVVRVVRGLGVDADDVAREWEGRWIEMGWLSRRFERDMSGAVADWAFVQDASYPAPPCPPCATLVDGGPEVRVYATTRAMAKLVMEDRARWLQAKVN